MRWLSVCVAKIYINILQSIVRYRSLQSASALQLVLDAINSAIGKLYFCGSSFLINYFLGQMKLNEFYNYVVKFEIYILLCSSKGRKLNVAQSQTFFYFHLK